MTRQYNKTGMYSNNPNFWDDKSNMTLKIAYEIGLNTGYEIANCNIYDYDDLFAINGDVRDSARDKFISDCLETESDHYRQFSPFEFTANDFNNSNDPDSTWDKYENGVYKGILKRLKEYSKNGY